MEGDNEGIVEYSKDIVDWICSSDGNFNETSIQNSELKFSQAMLKVVCEELSSDFLSMYEINDLETSRCLYANTVNQVGIINQSIFNALRENISNGTATITEFLSILHSDQTGNEGYFLKEEKALELLTQNVPKKTISALKDGGELESCIRIYGMYFLMALTRLYEDEEWHDNMYELYKRLQEEDFEKRALTYVFIDARNLLYLSPKYVDKYPIWDDKMMGTIFIFGMDMDNPSLYLRFITRLYHYEKEMRIHSEILDNMFLNNSFSRRFISYFLQSEKTEVAFFEPHCIMEALCWSESIKKVFDFLDRMHIDYSYFFNGNTCILLSPKVIISNNILDGVSNSFKGEKYPGKHRMFSMLYKLALLKYFMDDEMINDLLIANADQKSILFCKCGT